MSEERMIKCVCTQCGTVYDLPDNLIGQSAECASCSATFEIQDQTEFVNAALAQGEVSEEVAGDALVATDAPVAETPAEEPVETPAEIPAEEPVAPTEIPAEAPADPAPHVPTGTEKLSTARAPENPSATTKVPTANDDDGTVKVEKQDMSATNTVRLSRSKVGMLPNLADEQFKVGVVRSAAETTQVQTDTDKGIRFRTRRKFSSDTMRTTGVTTIVEEVSQPIAKPTKKWWEFWKK